MTFDWRSRALAALIHICGSAAVAALAAALVFWVWYPWPYSVLAGGIGLFVLVASVDVVIGPVVTFAIFDRSKGWELLRRDLGVILLLQCSALGYGVHVVFEARPVALALETDRFRVVRAVDVVLEELQLAPENLRRLSFSGPVVLRTVIPTDPDENFSAATAALGGVDLGVRPKYWREWDAVARTEAISGGRSLDALRRKYPTQTAELDAAVAHTGLGEGQLRYLPVLSHYGEWVVLIDATSGDVAGFAPFIGD